MVQHMLSLCSAYARAKKVKVGHELTRGLELGARIRVSPGESRGGERPPHWDILEREAQRVRVSIYAEHMPEAKGLKYARSMPSGPLGGGRGWTRPIDERGSVPLVK
jgi:hypothetical protein